MGCWFAHAVLLNLLFWASSCTAGSWASAARHQRVNGDAARLEQQAGGRGRAGHGPVTSGRQLQQIARPDGWAKCSNTSTGGAAYASIMEAVVKLNLSSLTQLLATANITTLLSDSTWNVTFLAPTDTAFRLLKQDFPTAQFPGAGGWDGSLPDRDQQAAQALAAFHMIAGSQAVQQAAQGPAGSSRVSPTWLTKFDVPPDFVNANVSLLSLGQGVVYAGGIVPGAILNLTCQVTAGDATLFVVDTLLVPPTISLVHQRGRAWLTPLEALAATPEVGIAAALLQSDPQLSALLRNPDLLATIFVPTDDALNATLAQMGSSLEEALGTTLAARILRNHVLPGMPLLSRTVPPGTSSGLATLSPVPADVLQLTNSPTTDGTITPGLTVRGAGNPAAIPVTTTTDPLNKRTADIRAGKCTLFIIDGVLLPAGALDASPTATPSASPSPAASQSASAPHQSSACQAPGSMQLAAWCLLAAAVLLGAG